MRLLSHNIWADNGYARLNGRNAQSPLDFTLLTNRPTPETANRPCEANPLILTQSSVKSLFPNRRGLSQKTSVFHDVSYQQNKPHKHWKGGDINNGMLKDEI